MAAFGRALRGERVFVDEAWHGRAMRTLYQPLAGGGVLQVSASMEPIHAAMYRMAWQLVLAGGIATVAAIVGRLLLRNVAMCFDPRAHAPPPRRYSRTVGARRRAAAASIALTTSGLIAVQR
jgi:hypothetical protein